MATHSSTLAWRIPRTEKPGRFHGVSESWKWLNDLAHIQGLLALDLRSPASSWARSC